MAFIVLVGVIAAWGFTVSLPWFRGRVFGKNMTPNDYVATELLLQRRNYSGSGWCLPTYYVVLGTSVSTTVLMFLGGYDNVSTTVLVY